MKLSNAELQAFIDSGCHCDSCQPEFHENRTDIAEELLESRGKIADSDREISSAQEDVKIWSERFEQEQEERDARGHKIAALEGRIAELERTRDAIQADANKALEKHRANTFTLQNEILALRRDLQRHRTGTQIEGDYVDPRDLQICNLQGKVAELEAEIEEYRNHALERSERE